MSELVECPQQIVTRLVIEAADEKGVLSHFASWDGCDVLLTYADDGRTLKVFVTPNFRK